MIKDPEEVTDERALAPGCFYFQLLGVAIGNIIVN